jgi:hypothetical protein
MTIKNYSRVGLITDAYSQEGVGLGAVGYVIEVYPGEKYDVEFSDAHGITIAQLVLDADEIVVIE